MTAEHQLTRVASQPFEVPRGLLAQTMRRLGSELARRRQIKRFVFSRLTLAAVATLPLLVTLNVAEALLLHAALVRFLPAAAAAALTSVVALSMLLTLALAYGSLPLLASFGLKLREHSP